MGDKPANVAHIHLNPNFGKAHINPNFLLKPKVPESIHINPNFLAKLYTPPPQPVPLPSPAQGKIIEKSRTKLVRAPTGSSSLIKHSTPAEFRSTHQIKLNSPLIRIGSRKLVRASLLKKDSAQPTVAPKTVHVRKNVYKVDRRPPKVKERRPTRKSFVGKYALCRVAEQGLLTPKKVTRTGRRVCRLEKTLKTGKSLLSINGVLYKSSKTKLEKTLPSQIKSEGTSQSTSIRKQASRERVLFVRGNKFVLEKGGLNLRRVGTTSSSRVPFRRIDIGGLTFVANSQDTLVRTDNHKTRNYLSTAKQKSINCLTRRLTKTNVPCPIFRKVGKCAAFERGKCMKVHDKKHVAICPLFLKGECITEKCLLSHEVSLAKMPTCRFFMQGLCTRSECPYLHKKLNDKTEICLEFLKGFCKLAEKCDKRHEFLCPDYESKGECSKVRCPYTHKKFDNIRPKSKGKTGSPKITRNVNDTPENTASSEVTILSEKSVSRYFQDRMHKKQNDGIEGNKSHSNLKSDSEENENNVIVQKRLKLGELPAYIPL